MVGIDDVTNSSLNLSGPRINERQCIAERIGMNDRTLVRREIQMMRLLTGRYSTNLLPCHRINHTDVGIQRVQNKQWRRL